MTTPIEISEEAKEAARKGQLSYSLSNSTDKPFVEVWAEVIQLAINSATAELSKLLLETKESLLNARALCAEKMDENTKLQQTVEGLREALSQITFDFIPNWERLNEHRIAIAEIRNRAELALSSTQSTNLVRREVLENLVNRQRHADSCLRMADSIRDTCDCGRVEALQEAQAELERTKP